MSNQIHPILLLSVSGQTFRLHARVRFSRSWRFKSKRSELWRLHMATLTSVPCSNRHSSLSSLVNINFIVYLLQLGSFASFPAANHQSFLTISLTFSTVLEAAWLSDLPSPVTSSLPSSNHLTYTKELCSGQCSLFHTISVTFCKFVLHFVSNFTSNLLLVPSCNNLSSVFLRKQGNKQKTLTKLAPIRKETES